MSHLVKSAILALIGAALTAQQMPKFTITDLGTSPGGTGSIASSLNDLGQVTGTALDANGTRSVMLWLPAPAYGRGPGLHSLGGLPNSRRAEGAFINARGEIVGVSDVPNAQAFLWLPRAAYGQPAGMNNLGNLSSPGSSSAHGINGAGQAVGLSAIGPRDSRGFLWRNGSMTQQGQTLGGRDTNFNEINDRGDIVGVSENRNGVLRATLFLQAPAYGLTAGVLHDLGTLGGRASAAWSINARGEIAGSADVGGDVPHAFLWLPAPAYGLRAGLNDLGTAGMSSATGRSINDAGWVVGFGGNRALLWIPGRGAADLNRLIPANTGWLLERANSVNAHGQIAGTGIAPNGRRHGFLLTPAPASFSSYGTGCRGVSLTMNAPPRLGTNPSATIAGYPTGTGRIAMVLGSVRIFPGVPLDVIGAPGCSQYVSLDLAFGVAVTGSTTTVPAIVGGIPASPDLLGAELFEQAVAVAPGANPAGILTSNGVALRLGR